jgi:hypothetical protein
MFFWRNWGRSKRVVELEPVYTEVVSPERFIELYKGERDNIESVKIVSGRLGSNDFGGFEVHRKRPVYSPYFTDALAER